MPQERLQKILAAAGIASRRECEEIIREGRVTVNGRVVDALPALADPDHDTIAVDGERLRAERKVYLLLHKPKGVQSTNDDPQGRRRTIDLLQGVRERVFPVGRLDADSTGLLLLTNDGELAQQLTHPRHEVPKTYQAHVDGVLTPAHIAALRKGIWLAEGKTQVSAARVVFHDRKQSVVEITLREGRNREIRRILAKIGFKVRRLVRTKIGPLTLKGLSVGRYRPLRREELATLRKTAAGDVSAEDRPPRRPRRPGRTHNAR